MSSNSWRFRSETPGIRASPRKSIVTFFSGDQSINIPWPLFGHCIQAIHGHLRALGETEFSER
jgi:hypothetical protein